MKQMTTYNKCKDCEFLEYWGYCTESICGEYCDRAEKNNSEEKQENNRIA